MVMRRESVPPSMNLLRLGPLPPGSAVIMSWHHLANSKCNMRNRPVRRKTNIAANGDGYAGIGYKAVHDHRYAYACRKAPAHRRCRSRRARDKAPGTRPGDRRMRSPPPAGAGMTEDRDALKQEAALAAG